MFSPVTSFVEGGVLLLLLPTTCQDRVRQRWQGQARSGVGRRRHRGVLRVLYVAPLVHDDDGPGKGCQ